jgi:hypothetical protein
MLTTERLRELFDYVAATGELVRKVAISPRAKVGEVIGWQHPDGYCYASVDKHSYPLSHLVWLWHGRDAVPELDHENRCNSDNRIENLREATRGQNMHNIGIAKNNTSGAKGVFWKKDKRKWRVRIGVNGKRIHIGDFDDFEFAELVAIEARAKYHGSFANHA